MCFLDNGCFLIQSIHVFILLFIFTELLPCIRHCVKHQRCKDGCNTFLTIENVRRSGQTIRVKESQVENLGLGAVEAPKMEQAVLSGAGQRGNLLHRGPDRKGSYRGADIFLSLESVHRLTRDRERQHSRQMEQSEQVHGNVKSLAVFK